MIKSRNIIRTERVACIEGMRNGCKLLVGKAGGMRPFGRPGRRWGDVNMEVREGCRLDSSDSE